MTAFLSRIRAIASKEVIQLRRDRLTLGMVVGIPALQLLLFGYAINTDIRHLKAAVADQAGTRMSRELVAAVEASQVADIVATGHTARDLEARLPGLDGVRGIADGVHARSTQPIDGRPGHGGRQPRDVLYKRLAIFRMRCWRYL